MTQYGIYHYRRFKDDLLFFISVRTVRSFIAAIKSRCAFFTIEVESLHNTVADFLDVTITLDDGFASTGSPGFFPRDRGQHTYVPLSKGSAHPSSVHTWPFGYLNRLSRLSSNILYFEISREMFVKRLCRFGASTTLCDALLATSPFLRGKTATEPQPVSQHIWLVLPFHPSFGGGLSQVVRSFVEATR